MFNPDEMLLLGAGGLLFGVLMCVSAYNFLVPKRKMDIMSGSDVRIDKVTDEKDYLTVQRGKHRNTVFPSHEDVATPEEATRGTVVQRPMSAKEAKDRLELNHDNQYKDKI